MNPQAQIARTGQARSLSSRFAHSASAAGALAVLAVNGLGCGIEPGGPADDADATASSASALSNPWPTSWFKSDLGTSTVTDDAGLTVIHYQGSTGNTTGGIATVQYAFATKAPANADLFFKWDYSGSHGSVKAEVRLRAFANGPNGRQEIFLVGTPQGEQPVSGAFGFSNKPYEAVLRVYEGEQYGFMVEGDDLDSPPVFRGDLNVQYRAEKIVKSAQWGGQLWPASSGQFSNIEQIAPPGKFISEVTAVWERNAIKGLSWRYSDDSCIHSGPCQVGWGSSDRAGNFTLDENDRLGQCYIRRSGYGYGSLRQLTLMKHPAMDASPQMTTKATFGPDGFDDEFMTQTDGARLVGFYGVYNKDGFMASIGLITRKAP